MLMAATPKTVLNNNWATATQTFTAVLNPFLTAQVDADVAQQPLHDAMAYTLASGGKRLRPVLAFVISQLGSAALSAQDFLFPAGAIELIQTYSLIHDDLPAMDNDDLRRGKPSNHIQFGEAQAILAGDGLLTLAFSWLARAPFNTAVRIAMVQALADAAGPAGMVAGQSQDMADTGEDITDTALHQLVANKTAQLITGAAEIGALAGQLTVSQRAAVRDFAWALGQAFQIRDDILDVIETTAELGKTAGKDAAEHKNTYVSFYGLAGARQQLQAALTAARAAWTPAVLASLGFAAMPAVLADLIQQLEE